MLSLFKDAIAGPGRPGFDGIALESGWDLAAILFENDGAGLAAHWDSRFAVPPSKFHARPLSAEENAIQFLAVHRVADACEQLVSSQNFRLATLVASIGFQRREIREQLKHWRENNAISEFSEPIRAIYELLSGNAGTCAGVKGPIESRASSFNISQRFQLTWAEAFGLRIWYTATDGNGTSDTGANASKAIRSYLADIEQDRERDPNCADWALMKLFATKQFDWADSNRSWLLTMFLYDNYSTATGKRKQILSFGPDAAEKLDAMTIATASQLEAAGNWVLAAFVLTHLRNSNSREPAIRDHLGRHAHLLGAPKDPNSAFSALERYDVPKSWIWDAKALYYRSRQNFLQEFLALLWSQDFAEANRTFLHRLAPELIIRRDYKLVFDFASLLYKVKDMLPDWETGALAYLLYPMLRIRDSYHPMDQSDSRLFDALVALRAGTHGDIREQAALADMAEELIRCRGADQRLYQLLPDDTKGKYVKTW